MTKSRYGMFAGIAGAAFAAWWWRRRAARQATNAGSVETIYSNAPEPSGLGGGPT